MADAKLRPFDAAVYLETPESVVAYLEDALADPNPGEFLHALGVVARAKGMSEIARKAGVARPALYRALDVGGHPDFGTIMNVMRTLGLRLNVQLADSA